MDVLTDDYVTADAHNGEDSNKEVEEYVDETGKKRKRRKRRIKVRKHSPEHYEELKAAKLNRKRENQWNNRFILESLPVRNEGAIQAKSTKKTLPKHHRPKIYSPKQENRIYQTFNAPANKGKSKTSKSFIVRVVNKKQQPNIDESSKKGNGVKTNENEHQSLLKALQQTFQSMKFDGHHYETLKDIIKNSKSKSLGSFIHAEIAKIKNHVSCCSKVEGAIKERQISVQELLTVEKQNEEELEEMKKQKINYYRVCTLKVIEEILKWKEELEKQFLTHTKMKTKLSYKREGKNYVTSMAQDVSSLCLEKDYEDVFLLSLTSETIDNELLVKIRACETLILEESLGYDES